MRPDDVYDRDGLAATITIARKGGAVNSPGLVKKIAVSPGDLHRDLGPLPVPRPGRRLWKCFLFDIYGNEENSVTFIGDDVDPDLWILAHGIVALYGKQPDHELRVLSLLPASTEPDEAAAARVLARGHEAYRLLSELGVDVRGGGMRITNDGDWLVYNLPAGTSPAVLGKQGTELGDMLTKLFKMPVRVRIQSAGDYA